MFPMKFFEYLAAGCPIVSTALPALRAYAHVAREHTYQRRTTRMLELLEAR
jgi:hypothetical protein